MVIPLLIPHGVVSVEVAAPEHGICVELDYVVVLFVDKLVQGSSSPDIMKKIKAKLGTIMKTKTTKAEATSEALQGLRKDMKRTKTLVFTINLNVLETDLGKANFNDDMRKKKKEKSTGSEPTEIISNSDEKSIKLLESQASSGSPVLGWTLPKPWTLTSTMPTAADGAGCQGLYLSLSHRPKDCPAALKQQSPRRDFGYKAQSKPIG
ncbi:hypothetical protein JB92DRAFT_3109233 [Gautieria morchelliformis]|nr:hypothetical protein JB92DRAFT_3109233 [Gautieria morchelliformis]